MHKMEELEISIKVEADAELQKWLILRLQKVFIVGAPPLNHDYCSHVAVLLVLDDGHMLARLTDRWRGEGGVSLVVDLLVRPICFTRWGVRLWRNVLCWEGGLQAVGRRSLSG